VRNVFSNWAAYFTSVLTSIFMTPFVVHRLGDELYGLWVLIGQLTGYMGLLDFGVRGAVHRYIARARALGDTGDLNRTFNTGLSILSVIGLAALAASVVIAYFLPTLFPAIRPELISDAQLSVIIVGINIAIGFPTNVFSGTLTGLQRYDIANANAIFSILLRVGLTIIALMAGYGIVTLAAVSLGVSLINHAIALYFCLRKRPDLRVDLVLRSRETMRLIANYSLYAFILSLAVKLIFYADSVIIGVILSPAHVTLYAVGGMLIEYLRRLVNDMTSVFVPVASEMEARSEFSRLQRLMILGTRFSLLITLPIGIVFILMGRSFISLWMGERYAEVAGTVLIILTVPQFFALAQCTSGAILMGISKHRFNAISALMEAAANVTLSVILAKRIGIYGVALGTAIPLIITQTLILPTYTTRVLSLSMFRYLKEAYLPPVAAAIPFLAIVYWFEKYYTAGSLPVLLLQITAATAVYLGAAWLICFSPGQRRRYASKLLRATTV